MKDTRVLRSLQNKLEWAKQMLEQYPGSQKCRERYESYQRTLDAMLTKPAASSATADPPEVAPTDPYSLLFPQ